MAFSFFSCRGRYSPFFRIDKLPQQLIKAVMKNDIKALKKAIGKGVDVNITHRFESGVEKLTPLQYAVKEGSVAVVKELLESGCDVNSLTPFDNCCALHFACRHQSPSTALMLVQELLKVAPDVNEGDHSGCTPIIIAAEVGNLELVRALIKAGADVNHVSACEDFPSSVQWSLDHLTMQQKDIDEMCDPFSGNTALMQACREHHVKVVRELIQSGSDFNLVNYAGNTALHLACKSESRNIYNDKLSRAPVAGHMIIVQDLIESGHELNPLNRHMETPLTRTLEGISEIVQWNISPQEKSREAENFCHIIKFLIQVGCDVNALDLDNQTLLYHTCRVTREVTSFGSRLTELLSEVIKMIVLSGCDANKEPTVPLDGLPSTVHQFLMWKIHNPYSLKQLCRMNTRQRLPKPIYRSLHLHCYLPKLPLPTAMKNYLSMSVIE